MRDIAEINSNNRKAAQDAAKEGRVPYVFWDKHEVRQVTDFFKLLPVLGDYTPDGWERVDTGRFYFPIHPQGQVYKPEETQGYIIATLQQFEGYRVGFGITYTGRNSAEATAYIQIPVVPVAVPDIRFDDWSREQLVEHIYKLERQLVDADDVVAFEDTKELLNAGY